MAWNVNLPDDASPGEAGHIDDHNIIVDAIEEVRVAIDNTPSSGFTRDDISVTAPVVKANNGVDGLILSAPTALTKANIVAGANITVTPAADPSNNVTIAATGTTDVSAKMEVNDFTAGTGISLAKNVGARTITITNTMPYTGQGGGSGSMPPSFINCGTASTNGGFLGGTTLYADGVNDDRPAIQAAIDAAEATNGVVQLGRVHAIGQGGTYGGLDISRGITLQGLGDRGTRLIHHSTTGGWLLTVHHAGRNGEWQANDSTYTTASDNSGVTLKDIHVDGQNRDNATQRYGFRILRADDLHMDNVTFGFLSGTALQIGGDGTVSNPADFETVRESDFTRLKIYKCGNTAVTGSISAKPAMLITIPSSTTDDGVNQLYFTDCRFVYNHGTDLHILNPHASEKIRRIQFKGLQFHGLSHDSLTGDNLADKSHDMCIVEGNVGGLLFDDVFANGAATNFSMFLFKAHAGTGLYADNITFNNFQCTNTDGNVFKLDKCNHISVRGYFDASTITGSILTTVSGTALENFDLDFSDVSNVSTLLGKLVIHSNFKNKGAIKINGFVLNQPVMLYPSGSGYDPEVDDTQSHIYLGSTTPGASFNVGKDIWVDTT